MPRCLAVRSGRQVRLVSRNQLSLDARFPELVEALECASAVDFVLDGEVVAFLALLLPYVIDVTAR